MAAIGETTPANPIATGECVIATPARVPVVDLSDAITAALAATEIKIEHEQPKQIEAKVEPKPCYLECYVNYVLELNEKETEFICKMENLPKPTKDKNYGTFVKEVFNVSPILAGNFALGYFDMSLVKTNKILVPEENIAALKKIMFDYRTLVKFDISVCHYRWTNMMIFDK